MVCMIDMFIRIATTSSFVIAFFIKFLFLNWETIKKKAFKLPPSAITNKSDRISVFNETKQYYIMFCCIARRIAKQKFIFFIFHLISYLPVRYLQVLIFKKS